MKRRPVRPSHPRSGGAGLEPLLAEGAGEFHGVSEAARAVTGGCWPGASSTQPWNAFTSARSQRTNAPLHGASTAAVTRLFCVSLRNRLGTEGSGQSPRFGKGSVEASFTARCKPHA